MQIVKHLTLFGLVACCSCKQEDKYPVASYTAKDLKNDEVVRDTVRRYAVNHHLAISENHYVHDFGCSNIYNLSDQDTEIIVRNPFSFDYEISVYTNNPRADHLGKTQILARLLSDTLNGLPEYDRKDIC
jgi:hypothetical protein